MVPLTAVPSGDSNWRAFTASWPWQPLQAGASSVSEQAYRQQEHEVFLTVQAHTGQSQAGAESIVGFKRLLGSKNSWQVVDQKHRTLKLEDGRFTVLEALIDNGVERLRVWYWFRVGPHFTGNPYLAKFFELWLRLNGKAGVAERLLLVSAEPPAGRSDETVMKQFVRQHPHLIGQGIGE